MRRRGVYCFTNTVCGLVWCFVHTKLWKMYYNKILPHLFPLFFFCLSGPSYDTLPINIILQCCRYRIRTSFVLIILWMMVAIGVRWWQLLDQKPHFHPLCMIVAKKFGKWNVFFIFCFGLDLEESITFIFHASYYCIILYASLE